MDGYMDDLRITKHKAIYSSFNMAGPLKYKTVPVPNEKLTTTPSIHAHHPHHSHRQSRAHQTRATPAYFGRPATKVASFTCTANTANAATGNEVGVGCALPNNGPYVRPLRTTSDDLTAMVATVEAYEVALGNGGEGSACATHPTSDACRNMLLDTELFTAPKGYFCSTNCAITGNAVSNQPGAIYTFSTPMTVSGLRVINHVNG
jgi:hypothetical protein